MTNEEIIEEILYKAEKLKIRVQVIDNSISLRKVFPKMTILDSIESSFNELKNEKKIGKKKHQ
jgi:2-hydroxy-3-keto-5-methylthiopentenyl-1-phosphate phosphatase